MTGDVVSGRGTVRLVSPAVKSMIQTVFATANKMLLVSYTSAAISALIPVVVVCVNEIAKVGLPTVSCRLNRFLLTTPPDADLNNLSPFLRITALLFVSVVDSAILRAALEVRILILFATSVGPTTMKLCFSEKADLVRLEETLVKLASTGTVESIPVTKFAGMDS